MKLHRTTGKPDWEMITPANRNVFQKGAAATYAIVTPPNVITIIGLALVVYGLLAIMQQHYWIGLVTVGVGRLLDIVDGWLAELTGTKSPTGEIFDAVADKIGTFLTIGVFFVAGVSYWWMMALLLIPQIAIPFITFYKKRRGVEIHPTRIGKLSMASAWVCLAGLLLIQATGQLWPSLLAGVVYAILFISVALGLYALWQYATDRDDSSK